MIEQEENSNGYGRISGDDIIQKKNTKFRKFLLIGLGLLLIIIVLIIVLVLLLSKPEKENEGEPNIPYSKILPMDKWGMNGNDKVYYMVGLRYVKNADEKYQRFGIYIPKEYMSCKENNDKRYTCLLENKNNNNGYTASTAPIVFNIDTPGYSSSEGPTEYDKEKIFKKFTDAGFIYISPGCRGREHGAPLGVVDLKAMVSYIKSQSGIIPGNVNTIFSMGMSGGGAQSSLMGVSGNSKVFEEYLNRMEVENKNNDIFGSMCWCPITNLEIGDEAYEWNLGLSRKNLTDDYLRISQELAGKFASYINEQKFRSENNETLELTESNEIEDLNYIAHYYQSGSYYNYIKKEIETSFNHWVNDTTFPFEKIEPIHIMTGYPSNEIEDIIEVSHTFHNLTEYLDYLNQNTNWISYENDEAKITNIKAFVNKCKSAEKGIGAFDDLEKKSTAENQLFGFNQDKLHFDQILGDVANKSQEFMKDIEKLDDLNNTVKHRLDMYSPLKYIQAENDSEFHSTIAKHWRIRSGLFQSDTSTCTEVNLKLALLNKGMNVDFETVWEQYHELAERGKKNPYDEFINWVNSILQNKTFS